jgi:hypothetical protein
MYQIESQTKTSTTEKETLCHRLTESLSSIHAVTRLSALLSLKAETVTELLAPLGILKGQAIDPTRLDALLHTAKALEVVEEYTITQEPHCLGLPLTVMTEGPEGLSVRIELPSGWLVELDLPGASLASEERARRQEHDRSFLS